MLLESVLIFFVLLGFFSYLRFHNITSRWEKPLTGKPAFSVPDPDWPLTSGFVVVDMNPPAVLSSAPGPGTVGCSSLVPPVLQLLGEKLTCDLWKVKVFSLLLWNTKCGTVCAFDVRVKYMGVFSYLLLLGVASLHTWTLIGDRTVSHVSPNSHCARSETETCLINPPITDRVSIGWFGFMKTLCYNLTLQVMFWSGGDTGVSLLTC